MAQGQGITFARWIGAKTEHWTPNNIYPVMRGDKIEMVCNLWVECPYFVDSCKDHGGWVNDQLNGKEDNPRWEPLNGPRDNRVGTVVTVIPRDVGVTYV